MAAEIACVGFGYMVLAAYLAFVCFGGIILNHIFVRTSYGLIGFQAFLSVLVFLFHEVVIVS